MMRYKFYWKQAENSSSVKRIKMFGKTEKKNNRKNVKHLFQMYPQQKIKCFHIQQAFLRDRIASKIKQALVKYRKVFDTR